MSIRHAALDVSVSFVKRTIQGHVTLTINRAEPSAGHSLVLDSRDLRIGSVALSSNGTDFQPGKWKMGAADPVRGTPVTIPLTPNATHVRIEYETSPDASALQWLTPQQTADRKAPFLYTQGQAIHTRSWIPLQDTPAVRMTYSARIRTPKDVMAVMSAGNGRAILPTGEYRFDMPQPIPPYLIALAVGHLQYQAIDRRTGVYAEPSVVSQAAREFEDLGKIIGAAEPLYGPYRWDQYDVLVLPPSFPYGGMENPRLTFVSPTLIAGDKSLVSVISHELAHSWSGNLVTNATWRDFWLNEGFTTYLERRIQELVYGRERAQMEAVIEYEQMRQELATVPDEHQALYASLDGRDPDNIPAAVAYSKGSLFLRTLEETWGRDRFDAFLRSYFDHFAFKSITTGDFVGYLEANLLSKDASLAGQVDIDQWLSKPGIPDSAVAPKSERLDRAASFARDWAEGKIRADSIPAENWTVQEWLRFLLALPPVVDPSRLAELDKRFSLTAETNAEVLFQWLITSIRSNYEPAYAAVERFLNQVGRRKFVKPLYEELVKSTEGRERARRIYVVARSGYHPVTQTAIDAVLR